MTLYGKITSAVRLKTSKTILERQGDSVYALPPNASTLGAEHKNLVTDLDENKLANVPHFHRDDWQELSNPTFASQVYQFYGKQPYWNAMSPTGRIGTPSQGAKQ